MSNVVENLSAQDGVADLTLVTRQLGVGEQLKKARQTRGWNVNQIAQRLNLSHRYIIALETDDFSILPGRTFIRGYLNNYAQCVGLEKEIILDAYDCCVSAHAKPAKLRKRERLKAFSTAPVMRALGALSVLLFVLSSMYWWRSEQLAVAAPAINNMTVVEVGTIDGGIKIKALDMDALLFVNDINSQYSDSGPSAAVLMGDVLLVKFTDSSWLNVRDASGKVLFSGVKPAGEELTLTSLTSFDIVIGNAAAVKLSYNSAPVDLSDYTLKSNAAELQLGM